MTTYRLLTTTLPNELEKRLKEKTKEKWGEDIDKELESNFDLRRSWILFRGLSLMLTTSIVSQDW